MRWAHEIDPDCIGRGFGSRPQRAVDTGRGESGRLGSGNFGCDESPIPSDTMQGRAASPAGAPGASPRLIALNPLGLSLRLVPATRADGVRQRTACERIHGGELAKSVLEPVPA